MVCASIFQRSSFICIVISILLLILGQLYTRELKKEACWKIQICTELDRIMVHSRNMVHCRVSGEGFKVFIILGLGQSRPWEALQQSPNSPKQAPMAPNKKSSDGLDLGAPVMWDACRILQLKALGVCGFRAAEVGESSAWGLQEDVSAIDFR